MDSKTQELVQAGWRVTILGVAVNAGLVLVKLAAGLLGHSQALVADAVHSMSDFVTDGVVLFGLKAGRKAPDEHHPFGHGRIETLAAAIIGLSLVAVAVYLAIDAGGSMMAGELSSPTPIALVGAGLSIVAKEVLYQLTVRAGRRARSTVVIANAWHHRSDAMSSVAVFIGAGAAQIDPAWRVFDSAAAILVALFVLRVAVGILATAVKEFTDTAPPGHVVHQMEAVAGAVNGVLDVHDVKVRTTGGLYLMQLHIAVDGSLTVVEGHNIAKQVEERLAAEIGDLAGVIVHVDPAQ
jgi:cation diffusion facilitator family transporter